MNYYNGNKYFGGVYPRDSIPKTLRKKFYVINLDKQTGPGTHWVLLFNINSPKYFDSFGAPPIEEIKIPVTSNRYRVQAMNSQNCGLYCIYFADELLKGRQLIDILLDFDPVDYENNERQIQFHFS